MAGFIYLLCAATSLFCSWLLWSGFRRRRVRLLFWASLCFLGLAGENVMLYIDKEVVPNVDLSMYRLLVGLASVAVLVYGLVWEAD
ncbi:MAG TPA: DUF5985 family protein [Pirellulales bacterium]|nr:DUF5985 family protein [Pirellulales bacterium]